MARSPKKEGFVYDFLYIDAKRIGLLLSQFGSDGIITELVRATDATTETGGKIDLKIVGINQKEGEKTGLVRKFDPQWLVPLIFLREAQDIIIRDISKARIGQLVIAPGILTISDLSILRKLWDVRFVQDSIAAGVTADSSAAALLEIVQQPPQVTNRRERRTMQRQTTRSPAPTSPAVESISRLLEVIKVMPHNILATLQVKNNEHVWCSLREEWLIITSADLMLNHGAVIAGDWNIVGILDARPDENDEVSTEVGSNASLPFLNILNTFAPLARQMLGRPTGSFGITPLMIFREVAA
jgi:hypothetical protein